MWHKWQIGASLMDALPASMKEPVLKTYLE